MTTAQLGLAVDSKQAARAAVDLDALTSAAGRAEKGAGGVGRASREMSASMQAMTSILQAIERHTSMMAAATERAAVTTGRYAIEQRQATSAATAAVTAAQRLAQVTNAEASASRELTSALQAEASAANAAAAAMNRRGVANDNRNPAAGYSSNIAAQAQDVIVTASMGMSPVQIALQQGTQLSAVLSDLRSTGMSTGAALAGAFASVVSPVSLVTLGLIGLSAAAIQYFSNMEKGGRTTEDVLKEHESLIARIKDRYGEAAKTLEAYTAQSEALERRQAQNNADDLRKRLEAEAESVLGAVGVVVEAAGKNLETVSTTAFGAIATGFEQASFTLSSKFDAFAAPIDELHKSIQSGSPAIVRFQEQVAKISASTSDAAVKKLADELLRVTDAGALAERALTPAAAAIAKIGEAAEAQASMIGSYGSALRALSEIALPDLSPRQMADQQLERALANSGGEQWREDLAYEQHQEAMTRIEQREGEKRLEQELERSDRQAEQMREALERRVEMHREALLSEEEQEQASYEKRAEDLTAFYEAGKMSHGEYLEWMQRAEEDMSKNIVQIRQREAEEEADIRAKAFGVAGDLMGAMADLAGAFGEKGFAAAKAFSIAQAVMNTAEGVTKALAQGGFLGFAGAAAVAAAGAAQIMTIANTKPGVASRPSVSGARGGTTAGSGTSAPAPEPAAQKTVYLQIKGEDRDTITVGQARQLFEHAIDLQRDGYKFVLANNLISGV